MTMGIQNLLMLVIISHCYSRVLSATLAEADSLYSTIMSGYNKYVRPAQDTFYPVDVNVTFQIVTIKELDEVNGKLSVVGFFIVSWSDSRITWDPVANNHIYLMEFPESEIWTPEVTLVNSYDKLTSMKKGFRVAQFLYDGTATWYPGDVMSVSCGLDVTKYPYDTQNCKLELTTWGYPKTQIALNSPSEDVSLELYTEHSIWNLLEIKAIERENPDLTFIDINIKLQRRSLFASINIILPMLFMVLLNVLVFILPVESGERTSYAITVLLSLAVFLTLVGDKLPESSKPMSIMSYFLLADLILSTVICFFTIVGLNIYFRDETEQPVPNWAKKLACKCNFKKCKKKSTAVQEIKVQSSPTPEQYDEDNEMEEITWKMIASALDKTVMVLCILIVIGLKVTYFMLVMF
ncbi:hypothetical protein FSP39_015384 [Pinctada imbricata]|uniref:Uncharacterized protein n=1 Tax=Pinctada imbricata TaxID=66713 RepID=A0AA88Y9J4_PINIB|nr:hypothetical protein FSP39_015384 [Pinctada imbricata]